MSVSTASGGMPASRYRLAYQPPEGLHSARRGGFRITYRITDVVTIVAIEHRADAYRSR